MGGEREAPYFVRIFAPLSRPSALQSAAHCMNLRCCHPVVLINFEKELRCERFQRFKRVVPDYDKLEMSFELCYRAECRVVRVEYLSPRHA